MEWFLEDKSSNDCIAYDIFKEIPEDQQKFRSCDNTPENETQIPTVRIPEVALLLLEQDDLKSLAKRLQKMRKISISEKSKVCWYSEKLSQTKRIQLWPSLGLQTMQ